jgi:hypothetical protein
MAYFKVLSWNLPGKMEEKPRKISVRIVSIRVVSNTGKISTGYIPNGSYTVKPSYSEIS